MSRPPVAWTRSAWVMRYCAAGMLGLSRHCSRSGGAPSRASTRRMISTRLLRRPLAARMRREDDGVAALDREDRRRPGGVSSGLVVGTSEAMRPTGLAYLTMPFSGSSSMTPTLFWRSTSRRMPMTLKRLPTRLSGSPMPLSSTPIRARRVNVASLATAQATAWQRRSTCSCVAPSNARSAARPRATSSSTCAVSSGVIGRAIVISRLPIAARAGRPWSVFHYRVQDRISERSRQPRPASRVSIESQQHLTRSPVADYVPS